MKESYRRGVAIRPGPESCVASREAAIEAFPGHEAGIHPAMECGSGHAQGLSRLADGQQVSAGRLRCRYKARDLMIAPQAGDLLCRETPSVGRLASLAIENAGNDVVRVMSSQPAQ